MIKAFAKKLFTISDRGNIIPLTGCLLVFISLFLPVYSFHSQIRMTVFETISSIINIGTDAGLLPFALLWGLFTVLLYMIIDNEKAGFILSVSALAFLCASFLLSQITFSSIGIGAYLFIGGIVLTGFAPLKI
jgi:hypothetical protein